MKIPEFKIKNELDEKGNPKKNESAQEKVSNILTYAIASHFSEKKQTQQGEEILSTLSGSQGRIWGRIQRKLDDVIDANSDSVELETSEVDFLKTAINGAKFPPTWFRWSVLIEDELDKK